MYKILLKVSLILTVIVLVGGFLFYVFIEKTEPIISTVSNSETLRGQVVYWQKRIEEVGPQKAYSEFLKLAPTLSLSTHDHAHAIGEALYTSEGLEGLSYCDNSFEFGCFHSFFGVAVHEKGEVVLSDFSEACKARFGDFNLPCEHGIGHGVLVYTDYNLVRALELCETISNLPTGGCSSGVFMENNFHTMDESVSEGFVRQLVNDGVYAPCSTLPNRFQASCYLEQVQWWQNIFNNDFTYIGTLCSSLREKSLENWEACFHGVGNYLSAYYNQDVSKTILGCKKLPDNLESDFCLEGASWLVFGGGDGAKKARDLCDATISDSYKVRCTEGTYR